MGYGNILFIYEDALVGVQKGSAEHDKLRTELGEAIIDICGDTLPIDKREGLYRTAGIGNHANAVNLVDKKHSSTEQGVYLWFGNCLMSIDDLKEEDLVKVKEMVEGEIAKRKSLGSKRVRRYDEEPPC